ncbi:MULTISPECIES: DUF732 domain-containing protein [unclassified Cryobacterium]|uniref:DUF732 domain-containing protein n=1 Tax=unclassified Cryobacterium TaxID=2649013 RepID=UPI00106A3BC4|nr:MULTISPECIES: DUF732 domain-containing protein [unclassified Cryobacterium]TFC59393.1 DUF732 domain-containing protein [Cryobacterium sp. TMB3-1-2]TFC67189.1 DUF732 domain-containing protein [Cryobacterium sp. TMB3-15]TFC73298.1 DUF732 domain-containing protein [Cryobacterium sp. TMB3-10]TFD46186.1 DUF732 domain-containing protein [Cryobacterium sp. TMB3-12]
MATTSLASAIALVVLVGCAAPPPEQLSDRDFRELSNSIDFYATYNDAGLEAAAKSVCETMETADANEAWVRALKSLIDQDVPAGDAGQFIVYATSARCPEMVELLPAME